jgi:hypothetical protein
MFIVEDPTALSPLRTILKSYVVVELKKKKKKKYCEYKIMVIILCTDN